MDMLTFAGNTYAPEGSLYWAQGQPVDLPAEQPCLLRMAICSALCNDSSLSFAAGEQAWLLNSHQHLSALPDKQHMLCAVTNMACRVYIVLHASTTCLSL